MNAQMLIPMAISLAFGIVFATVITLFLIPSLYLLQEDFGRGFQSMKLLLLGKDPLPATDPLQFNDALPATDPMVATGDSTYAQAESERVVLKDGDATD